MVDRLQQITIDHRVGRLIGSRYRVRALLARGGMATVYVATDIESGLTVAVKVMHSYLSDDPTFRARFLHEARAAERLSGPHVVNVLDRGQEGGMAYLVMEYIPGITLRELLIEQKSLSVPQTVTIMDAVLSGVSVAHHAGIVHRDVKPENVLLGEDGRIKISDFGLARATTANTATGAQLLGTIPYLAPELVTRGTADASSDIYSLGILLYEMLVGEQPYHGEPMQIAFQHATKSVPRPSSKNPGVPEPLDDLVLWATEKSPEDRPLDAQTMLQRLRQIALALGLSPSRGANGLGGEGAYIPPRDRKLSRIIPASLVRKTTVAELPAQTHDQLAKFAASLGMRLRGYSQPLRHVLATVDLDPVADEPTLLMLVRRAAGYRLQVSWIGNRRPDLAVLVERVRHALGTAYMERLDDEVPLVRFDPGENSESMLGARGSVIETAALLMADVSIRGPLSWDDLQD